MPFGEDCHTYGSPSFSVALSTSPKWVTGLKYMAAYDAIRSIAAISIGLFRSSFGFKVYMSATLNAFGGLAFGPNGILSNNERSCGWCSHLYLSCACSLEALGPS
jgi:hypothetical protein